MDILLACMSVHNIDTQCPWRSEDGISRNWVTSRFEPPCGCWEFEPRSSARTANALNWGAISTAPTIIVFILIKQIGLCDYQDSTIRTIKYIGKPSIYVCEEPLWWFKTCYSTTSWGPRLCSLYIAPWSEITIRGLSASLPVTAWLWTSDRASQCARLDV